jgi:hypothetical protein
MLKKAIPVLVLAALLVPAAAQAKKIEVAGPASIQGRGNVHGGLHAATPSEVKFRFRAAVLRVTGKAGDLKVSCEGERVKKLERANRRGLMVVVCKGRGLMVSVTATRFRFAARSRGAYGIDIPEGMRGVLYGHFRRGEGERPADEPEVSEKRR